MNIRIGTRRSKLALWQAYEVERKLQAAGLETEMVEIDTKGDKILDVTIAKIGSKGVFTEEIEAQLASGQIDIAVHSAKDMQSVLPDGFELIAFMEREQVNDVIISHTELPKLDEKADFVAGTSSTRRVALIKHYFPHLRTVNMRGNLQTRIRKLEEGQCDALILAYAGVHRMGYDDLIKEVIPLDRLTTPVGQGSVAIECSEHLEDEKKSQIRAILNHPDSATCLLAERAYLKKLEGGCSIPSFAFAELIADKVKIQGGIVSLDGSEIVKYTFEGSAQEPEPLGEKLAHAVLENGGQKILSEIKSQQAM